MLLLGLRNANSQALTTNDLVNLGGVYRKYCKKINGVKTFDTTDTTITLQQQGIYHITATIVANGQAAGVVGFSLVDNDEFLPTAYSSETITTASTEVRTFVIDTYILVDSTCVLGQPTTKIHNLQISNSGIASNVNAITINIDKVL